MHINQREDRLLDSWDVARLAHPSPYNQPEKKLIVRDRRPAALHLTSVKFRLRRRVITRGRDSHMKQTGMLVVSLRPGSNVEFHMCRT